MKQPRAVTIHGQNVDLYASGYGSITIDRQNLVDIIYGAFGAKDGVAVSGRFNIQVVITEVESSLSVVGVVPKEDEENGAS
jgi:hypothetical protein